MACYTCACISQHKKDWQADQQSTSQEREGCLTLLVVTLLSREQALVGFALLYVVQGRFKSKTEQDWTGGR
jgi:hypothetical protein